MKNHRTHEPDMETAATWWSELPAKWTPFGWKDHMFRFNVLYNGMISAVPDVNPRTAEWKGQGCQVGVWPSAKAEFPGHVTSPQDNGSVLQGWCDSPAPVLWSEWAQEGLVLREQSFAHIPGGRETQTGIEPFFAWVRLSIEDVLPGLPVPETYGFNVKINAPYIEVGAMSIRYNIAVIREKLPYPRELRADSREYDPGQGLRIVEPDGRVRLGIARGQDCRVEVLPDTPEKGDFLVFMELGTRAGAHVDLLLPMVPAEREVFDRELDLGYDAALAEANDFWASQVPPTAAVFDTPEEQINAAIRNNLNIARIIAEKDPVTGYSSVLTGSWAYADLWATPDAMQCSMFLDMMGYHADAGRYLRKYIETQGTVVPKGEYFVPHPGSLGPPARIAACVWTSDHGAVLWALAQHALTTGDEEYIGCATDAILRACEWVRDTRQIGGHGGFIGLMPPGMATDMPTEIQSVWADAWNYKGLSTAVKLLEKIGHPRAEEFAAEAEDYRRTFREALDSTTAEMPTWTDGEGREHRLVPMAVYGAQPFEYRNAFYLDTGPLVLVFAGLCHADEEKMASTVKWFREGPPRRVYRYDSDCWQVPSLQHEMSSCEPCFSWNVFHSWQSGDREHFLKGMYSLFAGSISRQTQTVCETRGGVTGVAGAHLPTYLARLAVVDDQVAEDELHLMRFMPLAWLREDRESLFEGMPTDFGRVSLCAGLDDGGRRLNVTYTSEYRTPPKRVILHIPPIDGLTEVVLNGKPIEWDGKAEWVEIGE